MAPAVASKRVTGKTPGVKYRGGSTAKTTAKTPAVVRPAPVEEEEVPSGPKVPVFVDGKPAMNRHYLLVESIAEAAAQQAAAEGWSLAEVLRLGFDEYVQGVRKSRSKKPAPLVSLPDEGLDVLAAAWRSGNREVQNTTLAAFHGAGWPLRTLAEALVASGAVKNMTRQGVSLRVLAAGDDLSGVATVVAPSGPRRTITVTDKKPRVELKDVGVRIANDVYAKAKSRARAEGAQMTALCEDILVRYLDGSFAMPKRTASE